MDQLIQKSLEKERAIDNGSRTPISGDLIPNVHQTIAGRKRFYKHVGIEEVKELPGKVRHCITSYDSDYRLHFII